MVKFKWLSALTIVNPTPRFADTLQRFLLKTVDPTSSTNFAKHQVVPHATVVQTYCEENIQEIRGFSTRCIRTSGIL